MADSQLSSFSSRTQIDHQEAGLSSVKGARDIIAMISARRMVARLILGLNDLGDDGTTVLFRYLSSTQGQKHRVAEISLNSNGIGDRGLFAIAEYLNDNLALKELFLQNNRFTGSPSVVEAFAFALNASHLETLSLTTNRTLSDPFLAHFLPRLDAPHLREIHLSAMDLTPRAAPHIVAFLSSPRCRLHTLKCNGNALGHRAVRAIIRAIERCNFGLLRVELYANQLSHGNYAEDEGIVGEAEGGQWAPTGVDLWKECERLLKRVLSRNKHLRRETQKEAVYLLRFTRALLLRPASVNPTADDPLLPRRHPNASCACIRAPTPPSSPASDRIPAPVFSFLCLPTELQLYILSFLAPTLSSAQRIRIYIYASSPGTLPSLLCLPSRGNSACRFGPLGVSGKEMVESGGKRAGVWGAQVGEKARWLVKVGCCVFEPEGEWNGRAECDF